MKTMRMPELKAELVGRGLGAYVNLDDARVKVLHALERTYAATPTLRSDGKSVDMQWSVRKTWLPATLRALMYPEPELPATPATLPAHKKQRKLGEAAYLCTPQGTGPLLGPMPSMPPLLPPPPKPLQPPATPALPAPQASAEQPKRASERLLDAGGRGA